MSGLRFMCRVAGIALAIVFACAPAAHAQDAEPDSLHDLFRQLADSTDAAYGEASVEYDTTGLDSLTAYDFGELPPPSERRRAGKFSLFPVLNYHRTEGLVLGGGIEGGTTRTGILRAEGSMGLENQGGRYAFRYRRPLWIGGLEMSERRRIEEPTIIERRHELDVVLEYSRTTEPFTPEHARKASSIRSVLFGRDEQSVYESRGFRGALMLWSGDWRLHAGYEDMRDRAMPLESRWSVFGNRDSVPDNIPATPDNYQAPFGGIAFQRTDWELRGRIDARGGGSDRWRIRGALGKALRLGSSLKLYAQGEYGAAAANAPVQRLFSVGGPRLLRTVRTGETLGDHLMGAKLDLVSSVDVLRSIGIGGPDWLVLNPWVFGEAAVLWDDDRNVIFSNPPGNLWRGAAGGGVVFRPGVPDPSLWVRFGYAARVGRQPGASHFTVSIDRAFDLLGKM